MTEKWLPVVGYEGLYSVSDHGRVRSEDRMIGHNDGSLRHWKGRILKTPCKRIKGKGRRYPSVALWRNNVQTTIRVQYLVLEAFIGPRPPGMEVLHWDDDPTNNALSNLRYGTYRENRDDMMRNNKTCKAGHRWTEKNIYIRPDTGQRTCGVCRQIRNDSRPRKTGTRHRKSAA